jgi:hypothetical protein
MRDACLGKKGATNLETNPEEIEFDVVHEEIPNEEATVETFGAPKKKNGDRHLALSCCSQLEKWTQGDGGSWKKLANACQAMTCQAGIARCKGHGHQGPSKDNIAQGTQKGQTFRKGYQPKLECNTRIRNGDLKEHLRLGSERTIGGIYRKAIVLEMVKRRVEPSVRIKKMSNWTLWRGRPPPK